MIINKNNKPYELIIYIRPDKKSEDEGYFSYKELKKESVRTYTKT